MAGRLFVVATPIGNLEDITLRALNTLKNVALIAAEDTRRTGLLLRHFGLATPATSLHEHNERQKVPHLLAKLEAGSDIALVSDAGTPLVADPGQRLVAAAISRGLQVVPVPGPSAILAALAVCGLPADEFVFAGFAPSKSNDRTRWLRSLADEQRPVVFFEAPHRITSTLEELRRAVGDCDVVVGRELTKMHEQLVRGPITAVLSTLELAKGEFTIVADIGEITELAPTDAAAVVSEFGELTKIRGLSRRNAISRLARRHGLAPNDVYAMIEDAKKSGE